MEKDNQSFIDKFIKKIAEKSLLTIAITMLVTIVGTGGFYILNKAGESVVSKLNYDFQGYSEKKYPDGSVLGPDDILNKEVITEIKNTMPEYAKLDIEKMFFPDKGASIKEGLDKEQGIRYYEIEIPVKLVEGGKDKVIKLIETINEHFLQKVKNKYNNLLINNSLLTEGEELDETFDSNTYFEIISKLNRQNTLINNFKSFVSQRDNNNGGLNKPYNNELEQYNLWFENNVSLLALEQEIINNSYVKNHVKTQESAASSILRIKRQIEINEAKIDVLTAKFIELTNGKDSVDTNSIISVLASYIEDNENLKKELELYEGFEFVAADNIDETFDNKLKGIYKTMSDFVDSVNEKYIEHQNENIKFITIGSKKYTVVKPYSMMIVVPASLVVGFLFAGTLLVALGEYKKSKSKQPSNIAAE